MSDYFDELETGLKDAVRRRAHVPWHSRLGQMSLRHRGVVAVIAALVIATPTVAAVGAVSGWFGKGSSPIYYPASATRGLGKVLPKDGHLLPIRVADPDGGPPWGIRLVKTTRGETCIQVGRVVDGQIGALGIDGSWNNDHKFHEIKPNDQMADMCGATDGAGDGFVNSANHGAVASVDVPLDNAVGAAGNGRCRDPYASVAIAGFANHLRHLPAKFRTQLERIERERRDDAACPLSSMRMVFAGLLGPDARSVTYKTPDGQTRTEPTVGGVGAYLIVFKETASDCSDFSQTLFNAPGATSCDGEGSGDTPDLQGPTAVTGVTYTDGKSCSDQISPSFAAAYREFTKRTHKLSGSRIRTLFTRFLMQHHLTNRSWFEAAQPACKPVGWRSANLPKLTSAEVASPITVKLLTGTRFCTKTREGTGFNGAVVCDRHVPAGYTSWYGSGPGLPATLVKISFIARQAVTSDNSTYSVFTKAPGNNGGSGSGTQSNLRAGQRVTLSWFVGEHVSGIYRGTIVFVQDKGSNGVAGTPFAIEHPGKGELVVGHFNFRYKAR